LHEIEAEGMILPETFQVATIVEKLPPAWRDFKNYLKHKRKELKLENLIVRLRIEEYNRKSEKRSSKNFYEAKANVNEDSKGKASTSKGLKRKKTAQGYKGKNMRFKGTYYICNKKGHKANECRSRLKKNKKNHPQANLTDHASPSFSAVVSEVNLTTNNKEWWVDTGATRHICYEKLLFSEYQKLEQDEQLFMESSVVSKVEGKGKVILKWTSGKELTLNDVLHIPDIRKNLISGSILSKKGYRMVFESDKFVLTKGGMYVGKDYLVDGLFKVNVAVVDKKSVYLYPKLINKGKNFCLFA